MAIDFPSDTRRRPSREEHFVLEDLPREERMLWGSLAYVCWPVALFKARWDPFVRFHVRQSIGLLLVWVLARLFSEFTFRYEIPEVSWLGYVAVTLLGCYGIRNALALEFRAMPWVGWIAHRALPLPKRLAEPQV